MKRRSRRREATPVAHMILSKRMADHKPHDMICELVDNALDAAARKAEALQLTSLALELEDYLKRMEESRGTDSVAAVPRESSPKEKTSGTSRQGRSRPAEGSAGSDATAKPRRGIQISWDPALRQMGELRAGIVRHADPGLREHELYAYYYDRVDQPAVAHESE